jgi:hypothetical protein
VSATKPPPIYGGKKPHTHKAEKGKFFQGCPRCDQLRRVSGG